MKHQVDFDLSHFGEDSEDYSYLEQAIQNITQNNNQNLEAMRNEKWFNRIFNLITLSNKKSIKVSEQITSIAQAQDILIEILKRLSNTDTKIDNMVLENSKNIERLYGYTEILTRKVKQLLNKVIAGIDEELNINDLNDEEKIILSSLLTHVASTYVHTSEDQKEFADKTLRYLGVNNSSIEIENAIESLDSTSKRKVLLQILLEYGFLYNKDFDFKEEFEEIIDYFDFGNKTIKSLKSKIEDIYHLRGIDGFTWFINYEDNYNDYFEFEIEKTEETVFENDKQLIENKYGIKTDETLREEIIEDLEIPYGETLKYENCKLSIKGEIRIEGNLLLKNSSINLVEGFETIKVNEGRVNIINCDFNSPILKKDEDDKEETIFLTSFKYKDIFDTYTSNIYIEGCLFDISIPFNSHDCGSFISIKKSKFTKILGEEIFINSEKLFMEECVFENQFVSKEKIQEEINSNNVFKDEEEIDVIKNYFYQPVFESDVIEIKNSTFNTIYNVFYSYESLKDYNSNYTDCTNIYDGLEHMVNVQNTDFYNCEKIFRGNVNGLLLDSKFENCNIIFMNTNGCEVKDCLFDNVVNFAEIASGLKISDCKFQNANFNEKYPLGNLPQGYIGFSVFKESESSEIRRCIFENINLEDNYLVKVKLIEKPYKYFSINVTENKIINVNSNNEDIFKLDDEYQHKLTRRYIYKSVGYASNNIFES